MQQYIKKVRIIPELDLSTFKNEMNNIPEDFGKIMNKLRKPFDDLQKNFASSINNISNQTKDKSATFGTQNGTILNASDLIKEINKSIEEQSYLTQNQPQTITDFFKGLSRGTNIFSNDALEEVKNRIVDLTDYLNFLKESNSELDSSIKSLEEKLKSSEGYDLYQQFLGYQNQIQENLNKIQSLDGVEGSENEINNLTANNAILRKDMNIISNTLQSKFPELLEIVNNISLLNDKQLELQDESQKALKEKEGLQNKIDLGKLDWKNTIDWKEAGKNLGNAIKDKIASSLKNFADSIKKTLSDALNEFDRMSQYNLKTSLRYNSEATEQAIKYGLSSAQNYALTRAKEDMNIGSEEDLLYMGQDARNEFAKKIGYYSTEYQKIEDKGLFKKYEEYQMQRQDFENKKQMVIIEFFAENKDTIINFMEVSMKVLSSMLSAITWIASKLGKDKKVTDEDRASMLSDLVNSYSISNSKTANVKIDNSFTNIPLNQQSSYVKAGERVNEQLIESLDGTLGGY